MRLSPRLRLAATILCALLAGRAGAACEPLVYGYSDQEARPYYLGNGASEAPAPGAAVELMREMAASAGCRLVTLRLPPARLQRGLESGTIGASLLSAPHFDAPGLAYPLDANGQPDRARGLLTYAVVYVRAADRVNADADPARYFKEHRLGTFHGASYADVLRQAGYDVDDGALDGPSNFEKLRLRRIDGYLVVVLAQDDMDTLVATRYGDGIVRLTRPLLAFPGWLPFNRAYYERNRPQVEAMWSWLGTQGQARFTALRAKYRAP